MTDLNAHASALRSLHRPGRPLVLVNAWDVASAERVVAAGGPAVATSSAAICEALGEPDAPTASLDALFDVISRIASRVAVPVSADVLDGYGVPPTELVERLLGAGAVGCNLEDSDHAAPGALIDPGRMAERIAEVRSAATAAGVDIVLNARVDAYLHQGPDATAEVLMRGRRYVDAGADCIYPIRLTDPSVARILVSELDGPINANLGNSTIAALADAGVSRISVGPMAFHIAYAAFGHRATELLANVRSS